MKNNDEGLFVRDSRFFRYTVNHSKQEFFDPQKTQLICSNKCGLRIAPEKDYLTVLDFIGQANKRYNLLHIRMIVLEQS